jgi:predicted RNase H-like HicB family nuclease
VLARCSFPEFDVTVREVIKLNRIGWLGPDPATRQPPTVQAPRETGTSYCGWAIENKTGAQNAEKHLPPSGTESMKYLIILERTSTGYSAYSPDLDGCVAAAATRAKTVALMREAIAFHLEGLEEDGLKAPTARSESEYVEISA